MKESRLELRRLRPTRTGNRLLEKGLLNSNPHLGSNGGGKVHAIRLSFDRSLDGRHHAAAEEHYSRDILNV